MNPMSCALPVALLAALAAPHPAAAQAAPIELKADTPYSHPAGKQLDLYRFLSVVGTRVTVTATVPGPATVTLYTPEGDRMMSADGSGTVSLEAVLPTTGMYMASVARAARNKSYTMRVTAPEPSLLHAYAAMGVGYGGRGEKPYYTCWVEPGRQRKYVGPDTQLVTTVVDEDHTVTTFPDSELSFETRLVEVGGRLIARNHWNRAADDEHVVDFESAISGSNPAAFWNGYLCSDADRGGASR
jgi:hypothetical protein